MFPLQVLISICKRKSLTSCTSQQQLLYVNKLTEVIKQTVSGNLITSHWDLGKVLGILDSLLWHPRLLEATIRPERTFLIGVFLPSQKSEHQKPVENFPNSLPWEWQGWCRARSLEKKKKKNWKEKKEELSVSSHLSAQLKDDCGLRGHFGSDFWTFNYVRFLASGHFSGWRGLSFLIWYERGACPLWS